MSSIKLKSLRLTGSFLLKAELKMLATMAGQQQK